MTDQTDHQARVWEAEAAYSDLTCRIIGAYDQSDEMAQRIVEWESAHARLVAAVAARERAKCRMAVRAAFPHEQDEAAGDIAVDTIAALEPQA